MTRILVFSDSHGAVGKMIKIIESMPGLSGIIHLGDINRDILTLEDTFFDIPIYGVQGNNDYTGSYPNEKLLTIDGKKIFMTHGHYYLSGFDSSRLKTAPRAETADLILYGHTHIADTEQWGDKLIANPGSISRPRRGEASYGIIEIENGKLSYANIFIP